jgi:hypothetical protein
MIRPQTPQSFVARIWLERNAGEDAKWRGHIQHVQGGEEIYFQSFAEVCEFLAQVSGASAAALGTAAARPVAVGPRGDAAGRKRKASE